MVENIRRNSTLAVIDASPEGGRWKLYDVVDDSYACCYRPVIGRD